MYNVDIPNKQGANTMKFNTFTVSANLGANIVREVLEIEAKTWKDAREIANIMLEEAGRVNVFQILPIKKDAIPERIQRERARG